MGSEATPPNVGYDREQKIRKILDDLHWNVKYHPAIRSGSTIFEPDFIAEKDGTVIVVESKAGPATISDIGMLSNIKADRRLVVSDGAISGSVSDQAEHSKPKIEIIHSIDAFGQYLRTISDKKDFVNKTRSRIGYSMTTSEEK